MKDSHEDNSVSRDVSMKEIHHDEGSTKLVDRSEHDFLQDSVVQPIPGQKVVDCQKIIRLGFIRKVYGILSIQVLATALICALAMRVTGEYVGNYETLSFGSFIVSSRPFYIFLFVVSLIMLIALLCYKNVYPVNYALLALWTCSMALTVASACVVTLCDPMVVTKSGNVVPLSLALDHSGENLHLYHDSVHCALGTEVEKSGTNSVLMALFITASLFFGLTIFTFQSKWDFSYLGAGLGASLWILILWGICMSFFGGSGLMRYVYSLVGAVIFSLYIIFDTWQLSCKYTPDDYILAVIDLYLDIINLFIMILQLLSDRRN